MRTKERDTEIFEYFEQNFGLLENLSYPKIEDTESFPWLIKEFWNKFGLGSRTDEYIWFVDPNSAKWIHDYFEIDKSFFPFAHDAYADFYFSDAGGGLHRFSPSYKEMVTVSENFYSSIMSICDKEFTDDEVLYARHLEMQKIGEKLTADTCYCFSPAVPLGGDEDTSDIYVGDIQTYLKLLSEL